VIFYVFVVYCIPPPDTFRTHFRPSVPPGRAGIDPDTVT
jgi:hypothetical protein